MLVYRRGTKLVLYAVPPRETRKRMVTSPPEPSRGGAGHSRRESETYTAAVSGAGDREEAVERLLLVPPVPSRPSKEQYRAELLLPPLLLPLALLLLAVVERF